MKDSRDVVTSAAQGHRSEMLTSLANPFAACSKHTCFALEAQNVRTRVFQAFDRPEEALAFSAFETLNILLAHNGFLLKAMGRALDGGDVLWQSRLGEG